MLEDMAILTGGRVVAQELGMKLEHCEVAHLGRAERVILTANDTTLVKGAGDTAYIQARIEQLRQQVKDSHSDYDREKLHERLAKLSGGVAVIRVGAPSEAEMKSRKEAFDDAVHSTQAAMAEGIVPGCGLSLLRALDAVSREEELASGDEKVGLRILMHALEAPTRQIAENSGVDGGVVVDRMKQGHGHFGFDAASGQYVDLMENGIVDPAKVVRVALENAVSVASVLLLTEATLTEIPEAHQERTESMMP
jgi:chaperonin GroEL